MLDRAAGCCASSTTRPRASTAPAGSGRCPRASRPRSICHNDFAPYNLAFRDGLPVGAIDFEAASPGPRAWDLAYLAYRLVPLAHPANPDLPAARPTPPRASPRSAAAYGGIDPADVLALVPERLRALAATAPPAHAELYRADATHIERWITTASDRVIHRSRLRGRG